MRFLKYKDNLKQTWKIIGSLIKRKTKGQISPSRVIHNNMTFTKEKDMAELFNRFFVNIGPTLAKEIKTDHTDLTQFSIYTLSDLGVLSHLIGPLSLANEHYSPPTE